MGRSAKNILEKYDRENRERAEAGNPYALKDSRGKFLRNRKTRFLIKKIKNPVLEWFVKTVVLMLLAAFFTWVVFSVYTFFNEAGGYALIVSGVSV